MSVIVIAPKILKKTANIALSKRFFHQKSEIELNSGRQFAVTERKVRAARAVLMRQMRLVNAQLCPCQMFG